MQILASCSLEEAKGFNGKLVLPNEDDKKPDKVYLNIVFNGEKPHKEFFEEVATIGKGIVKCITFKGEEAVCFVPDEWKGRVFNECDLDRFVNDPCFPEPKGSIPLVRIPDSDFCNMKLLYDVSKGSETVRFIGGNLLGVDGVRIGRFDDGKERMSPVFNGIYDTFVEVDLNDLDGLQEIVKKTRKKAEGIEGSKKKKPKVSGKKKEKKSPKRVETFNKLFTSETEEEF